LHQKIPSFASPSSYHPTPTPTLIISVSAVAQSGLPLEWTLSKEHLYAGTVEAIEFIRVCNNHCICALKNTSGFLG
jgi:hypothetical protein